MERRGLLWSLCAAVCGCAGKKPTGLVLPAELAGGWRREASAEMPAAQAPEAVRQMSLKRAWQAVYVGPAMVTVTVYEMTTGSAAFELRQRWRPTPGAIHFHEGPYFVILESTAASTAALSAVAAELEKVFRNAGASGG